jgi:ATP-dependent RNA helicase DeaD
VDYNPDIFGIVFSRTKMETQEIAEALIKDGYNADSLHGDLSQQQRDKVMKRYRDRSLQLLIATDVAARGIDVSDVTHVINFSLPDDIESYTHRSGRTGRAGKTGISIALITGKDVGKIRQIEKMIGKKFTQGEVPNAFDVCEKQLFSLVHRVHNVEVNEEQIGQYMQRIYDELADMDKEEVIRRFVSLEFNRFLEYYKNAPDLNAKADDRGSDRNSMREGKGDVTRMFINLGSVDEFTRGDMLRFICDTSGIPGSSIGRIDVKGVYSFFEIDNKFVDEINAGFKTANFKGRDVRIEVSNDGDRKGGGDRDRKRSYGGGDSGFRKSDGGDRKRSGGGSSYSSGKREGGGGYGKSSSGRSRSEGSSREGGTRERSFGGNRSEGSGTRERSGSRSSDAGARPRRERKDSGKGGKW